MRTTARTLRFCVALCAGAIAAACAEREPASITGADVMNAPVSGANLQSAQTIGGDPFFIAWTGGSFSSSPIQTQVTSGPDAREYRQYTGFVADAGVLAFAAANPGKLYINGDEPDQGCIAPSDYAVIYHDYVAAIRGADPTALVSPSGFAEPNSVQCPGAPPDFFTSMHSIGYAQKFYDSYIAQYGVVPPVNEWRLHDFGLGYNGNLATWWAHVSNEAAWSVSHGANMVLGSWGFLDWTEPISTLQGHMRQAMDLLINDGRINQAAYWSYENTGVPHYLVDGAGSLTPEGQTYASPPAVMSTLITGGSTVPPHVSCTWVANVSGGVPPYHYVWTANNQPVGSDSQSLPYTNNGSNFRLLVTVTDQYGVVKSDSKVIGVSSGGHC